MLKRIATEYKRVSLWLEERDVTDLIEFLQREGVSLKERVLENGDLELTLARGADEIHLNLEKKGRRYHMSTTCIVRDRMLVETMRKVMAHFKGEATVYRLYPTFKVEYRYERGKVLTIREITGEEEKLIFENRDFAFLLEKIMEDQAVEAEIEAIRARVDALLDERNRAKSCGDREKIYLIDRHLSDCAKRLFVLEA